MQTVTSEKLYRLIKALEPDQREVLDKHFLAERKTKVAILYKRLKGLSKWNAGAEEQIRKKHFTNSGFYWANRKTLAVRIVTLLTPATASTPSLAFVKTAIDLDLVAVANERAVLETEKAHSEGDLPYLHLLLTTLHELETNFLIQFELPDHLPHWTETHVALDRRHQLLKVLNGIRQSFKTSLANRAAVAEQVLAEVAARDWGDEALGLEYRKVQVGVALLQGNVDAAIKAQRGIVELLDGGGYGLSQVARELTIYIRFMMYVHNVDEVLKFTFKLSSLKKGTIIENKLRKNHTLATQVIVAEFLAQKDMAETVATVLKQSVDIRKDIQAGLMIRLSLCYFYHGKLEEALEWMHEIAKIPAKYCSSIDWEYPLFSAILHWERGNYDMVDTFLNSAGRKALKNENAYPKKATRAIRTIFFDKDPWSKAPNILKELNSVLRSPQEARSAWLLDIRYYLESKLGSKPLDQLIRESRRKPYSIRISKETI